MSDFEKMPIDPSSQERATENNIKITINSGAYDMLDILVDSYRKRLPPYDEVVLPQEFKPDSLRPDGIYHDTPRHCMYFWMACGYMSGRIKSDVAFKRMTEIFDERPELFDCQTLAQTDPSIIAEVLRNHGLGRQNKVATNWVENAQKLVDRYDGDPRNIFTGNPSYDDCVSRIKNENGGNGFRGFREKMASMILYFFMDEGIISGHNFPPPVDFHVQRVVLATKMITVEPRDFRKCDAFESAVRKFLHEYLGERDVSPLELTDAIWLLSANLCKQSPGNYSYIGEENGRVRHNAERIDPDNLRHAELYRRSCGRCALRESCKYYVPFGPYYTNGLFLLREKAVKDEDFAKQFDLFALVDK
jgi:endonuclease III